jgi:hypothetical protein
LECWSIAVLEKWLKGGYLLSTLQYSITPVLQDRRTQGHWVTLCLLF